MAPQHSHGMTLGRSTDALTGTPSSFTAVGEVVDINPPGKSRTKIVTTPHSETNEESIPGRIVANGSVTAMLNYDPDNESSQRDVESDFDDAETRWWRVTSPSPSSSTWTFKGWIMRFDVQTPEDDRITAEVEIVVTGSVTKVN